MIHYVKGDATDPQGGDVKYIIHVVNDQGGWGGRNSFVKAVTRRLGEGPEMFYREWAEDKSDPLTGVPFELGQVQYIPLGRELLICNMLAQRGYSQKGSVALDYDALATCLKRISDDCAEATFKVSLHGPRFGTGLAGGAWWRVEQIIRENVRGMDVFIYDPPDANR